MKNLRNSLLTAIYEDYRFGFLNPSDFAEELSKGKGYVLVGVKRNLKHLKAEAITKEELEYIKSEEGRKQIQFYIETETAMRVKIFNSRPVK